MNIKNFESFEKMQTLRWDLYGDREYFQKYLSNRHPPEWLVQNHGWGKGAYMPETREDYIEGIIISFKLDQEEE